MGGMGRAGVVAGRRAVVIEIICDRDGRRTATGVATEAAG